jgi:uncharacterized protein (TIGR03663 family)
MASPDIKRFVAGISRLAEQKHTALLVSALFVLMLVLRFYPIELRPLHHDEGVNGYFTLKVLAGEWQYDASNYHGPALFYLNGLAFLLFGASTFALRFFPAVFGSMLVLLLWPLRRELGKAGIVIAGLLMVFSASIYYYSIDGIHEILFVFFSLASIVAVWRYTQQPSRFWLVCSASALALLFSTKESAFPIGPLIVILFLLVPNMAKCRKHASDSLLNRDAWKNIAFALAIFFAIVGLFYVVLPRDFEGMQKFFSSPAIWGERLEKGNTGHEKPWYYYIELMLLYEPLVLMLGIAGALLSLWRRHVFGILLATYVTLTLAGSSLVAYKTPWIVINFTLPFAVLAGIAAKHLLETKPPLEKPRATTTVPIIVIFGLVVVSTAFNGLGLVLYNYEEPTHKLVYVQTRNSTKAFLQELEDYRTEKGTISVMVASKTSSWPLPFYLRHYKPAYYNPTKVNSRIIAKYDVAVIEQRYLYLYKDSIVHACKRVKFSIRPGAEFTAIFTRVCEKE